MVDESKTREDLLRELEELRGLVSELNAARHHGYDAKRFSKQLERREGPQGHKETDDSTLIDGEYSFTDLVNMESLRKVLEKFSSATGFTTGLVSFPAQEVLVATGWKEICTKFHRAFPESAKHCRKSNIDLTKRLRDLKQLNVRACGNGMVDGATPIIVKGKYVASLFTGQCLFEKPDVNEFRKRAATYGYDVDDYLEALSKVRVVSKEEFEAALSFLSELAVLIAEQGFGGLTLRQRTRELEEEIAERKKTKEALQQSEEFYRGLVEATDTGYVVIDEMGKVVDANAEYVRLSGNKDLEEVLGRSVVEWTAEPDKERNAFEVKKCFQKGFVRHLEIDYVDGSGNFIPIEINATLIDGNDGQKIVTLCRDITERKQIEAALLEEKQRFQALAENSPFGMVMIGETVRFGTLILSLLKYLATTQLR